MASRWLKLSPVEAFSKGAMPYSSCIHTKGPKKGQPYNNFDINLTRLSSPSFH